MGVNGSKTTDTWEKDNTLFSPRNFKIWSVQYFKFLLKPKKIIDLFKYRIHSNKRPGAYKIYWKVRGGAC